MPVSAALVLVLYIWNFWTVLGNWTYNLGISCTTVWATRAFCPSQTLPTHSFLKCKTDLAADHHQPPSQSLPSLYLKTSPLIFPPSDIILWHHTLSLTILLLLMAAHSSVLTTSPRWNSRGSVLQGAIIIISHWNGNLVTPRGCELVRVLGNPRSQTADESSRGGTF